MDWPSQNGTLAELNNILRALPKCDTGTISSVGLNIGGDPSRDPNDRDFGTVTAFVHVLDSLAMQSQLGADEWNKIVKIDNEGRKPGLYPLDHPESWLVVMPEWRNTI
ncbi:hypothetical protein CBS101457_004919 [Exobasidium rhododendri]|nr:hypothetical protein CBS101457_004919 [Exobasidium rhododendri]